MSPDAFMLAVALMCPSTMVVDTFIDQKPRPLVSCQADEQDVNFNNKHLKARAGDCEEILLCVQVGWHMEQKRKPIRKR